MNMNTETKGGKFLRVYTVSQYSKTRNLRLVGWGYAAGIIVFVSFPIP